MVVAGCSSKMKKSGKKREIMKNGWAAGPKVFLVLYNMFSLKEKKIEPVPKNNNDKTKGLESVRKYN